MKETQRLLKSLVACGLALAMVSTLAAQPADQGGARVFRLKGGARYKTGNNDWQPLKVGDVLRSGAVIQTAANSRVDLSMGDSSVPVATAAPPSEMISYQPTAEQNVVRIWENTLLGIDKLTATQTGADVVTETMLDLKAGRITGSVKKMSTASKYEIKLPNGVAGIRGTVYDITADGVIKVLSGLVVLAYVGPDGSPITQVINGMQQFDSRTGVLSSLPPASESAIRGVINQLRVPSLTPTPVSANYSLQFISPH
jgi:hypothetical protein